MIVLDTNVISEALKPFPEQRVLGWLNDQIAPTIYTTSITLAEMLVGIELLPEGKRKQALHMMLEQVSGRLFAGRVLSFDAVTAPKMAEVSRLAVSKGYNILFADCQIAAIAAFHDFAVATRDEAPFRAAGVTVINPWTA
jgi:predicted nucleic acid-binding protein